MLPTILTINEVEKYPGWEVFLQDISRGWSALNTALSYVAPRRIGLRYINLIPRRNPGEPLSAWLKPTKYFPSAILNCSSGFLARGEFGLKADRRLIASLSEPMQPATQGGIVFDIDVISALHEEADWQDICAELNELHSIAWEVFSSSISQQYEDLLNGELLWITS